MRTYEKDGHESGIIILGLIYHSIAKGGVHMLDSFLAFHLNAISNFIYMISSNLWFLLLLFGVLGTIILLLKEEVDTSIREEQNII